MFKKILGISPIIIACLVFFLFSDNNIEKDKDVTNLTKGSPIEKNIINFEGKTDGFESLKQLEDESSIIIKGVKGKEVGTEIFKSKIDDGLSGGYTKSNLKITKVYKNNENNDKVKLGNNILILESSFYDKETKTTYSINGYENMKDGNEYLLFLTPEVEGLFATRGVTFGKIPLNNTENEINEDDSLSMELLNELFYEARVKYKN